jgi:hypothetical protein
LKLDISTIDNDVFFAKTQCFFDRLLDDAAADANAALFDGAFADLQILFNDRNRHITGRLGSVFRRRTA